MNNKPHYDVVTDTIHNCKPYTFTWWHEMGHKNQFSYTFVRYLDKNLYGLDGNNIFYAIWNQLLEIDANIYAFFKWIRKKG